jgi:signal transduction histidine kinase/predicted CoA-binding protein
MLDFLRIVPLFSDLPDDDLERLASKVEVVRLRAGEELFAQDSPGDRAYIIQDGEVEVIRTTDGRAVLLSVRGRGDVIGEMSLLESAPRNASVRAHSDAVLLGIGQEEFDHLLNTSTAALRALLHTVLARLRATEIVVRQSEKMAQLGTLTAGVAHELNNPAAAVARAAGQLSAAIVEWSAAQTRLSRLALTAEQHDVLDELEHKVPELARRPPELDSLARSDREEELENWLDDEGIEDAWELAPILVNLDYQPDDLASLASQFGPELLATIVGWLGALYTAHNLLAEINYGAGRIAEIVKALKSYSYLDQGPVQSVDIHKGIDESLMILRHKLKTGISVRRDYAPDLPKIEAYGSELNQVWTNLIDNAADALNGQGQIIISTRCEEDCWIVVEVEDNGPGIPADIQQRIFDPFFTTKPVGKGTGLGLYIAYNIVVDKHRGDIKLHSQPGRTCFQVWLPVQLNAAQILPPLQPFPKVSEEQLRRILEETRTIAVVGISARGDRPSHTVPAYLQGQGYRIIPVNPSLDKILGEQAYPDLKSIPEPVDVVLIFQRSEAVPPTVDDAIAIGAKVVWMQQGIVNERAAETALAAGLEVVMDTCMRTVHQRLKSQLKPVAR